MMGENYWIDIEQVMDSGECNYRRTAYVLLALARELDAQLERLTEKETANVAQG